MAINSQKVISREEIKALIAKEANDLPDEAKKLMEDALYKMAVEGKTPMAAMNVTQSGIDQQYQDAYKKFQSGKYQEAIEIFRMLELLDPNNASKYFFAEGAALQYQKKYEAAAGSYIQATIFDPLNPIPRYHLYDCFMKTNQPHAAFWAISEALFLAGQDPQYTSLKAKAELEKKHLVDLIRTMNDEKDKAKAAAQGKQGE